ncbi:MAG: zf-HC2 domain-containing protein [Actinomycetota bacterium]
MTELEHSTVGELLRPHLEGTLDPATEQAVVTHLRGCAECRREEAGLRMLLAPVEQLTTGERSRLRAGLNAAGAGESRPTAEVVTLRRPLLARLAPALGAAALLAIVVVSLAQIDFGGTVTGEDSAGQTQRSAAEAPAAGGGEALDAQVVPVEPVFDRRAGTLAVGDLQRLGRDGFSAPRRSLENASLEMTTDTGAGTEQRAARLGDLDAYRDPMLSALTDQAGEDVISECAGTVFAGGYARIAPVYGAFGRYDKQRVLILGFLWSNNPRGPLDNYTIWIWPRDSCAVALQSISGIVRR